MKSTHWPLTILNTLVSLIQLFLPLVLIRIFSTEEIGTYKVFFLYLNLLPMLSFSSGLTHGLAFWSRDLDKSLNLVRQVWSITGYYTLILAVAASLLAPRLLLGLGLSPAQSAALIVSGAVLLLSNFCEEAWISSNRIWAAALLRASFEVVRAGTMLLSAWNYGTVTSVFVAHAAVMLVKCFLLTALSIRKGIIGSAWNRDWVREICAYALPVSAAGFLAAIANYADQLLLSTVLTRTDFAIYAMGCLILPPLFALEQSVNQLLAVRMAKHLAAKDMLSARKAYREAVVELSRFLIPSALGLIVFAEPIVRLLYTAAYMQSAPILRLYALNYLLFCVPYDAGPKASGNGAWALRIFAVKTIISIVCVILLGRWFGVYGALSGMILSGIFLRLAGLHFNLTVLGWKLSDFVPVSTVAGIFTWSCTLAAGCLIVKDAFGSQISWFLTMSAVFSLIYWFYALRPGSLQRLLSSVAQPLPTD